MTWQKHTVKCSAQISTQNTGQSFGQFGWMVECFYELSGSGFESSSSHLNFRFRACFEQGAPLNPSNYRVSIHSEMRTWHDNNIQPWNVIILNMEIITKTRGEAQLLNDHYLFPESFKKFCQTKNYYFSLLVLD